MTTWWTRTTWRPIAINEMKSEISIEGRKRGGGKEEGRLKRGGSRVECIEMQIVEIHPTHPYPIQSTVRGVPRSRLRCRQANPYILRPHSKHGHEAGWTGVSRCGYTRNTPRASRTQAIPSGTRSEQRRDDSCYIWHRAASRLTQWRVSHTVGEANDLNSERLIPWRS